MKKQAFIFLAVVSLLLAITQIILIIISGFTGIKLFITILGALSMVLITWVFYMKSIKSAREKNL